MVSVSESFFWNSSWFSIRLFMAPREAPTSVICFIMASTVEIISSSCTAVVEPSRVISVVAAPASSFNTA
ncbi:hypothetical protein D3C71_2234560 [compost metagenome]